MGHGSGLFGLATALRRVGPPRSPRATRVDAEAVTLRWSAPKRGKPARYVVFRNGRRLARTTRRFHTDRKVTPGRTYRYTVRAVDARGRRGALSRAVRVLVPRRGSGAPSPTDPGANTNPVGPIAPVAPAPPAPPPPVTLTAAMVDRLLWRAGFGPSATQRATWIGRTPAALVDWLLDTAPTLAATSTPPLTLTNQPIDPLAFDDELVMEWLDAMQRVDNPLPERLAFFWHRHWAVSRDDGLPARWLLTYRDRMRSFADLPANPNLSYRTIALEMTTKDGAMSAFLNGNQNTKTRPNENYAREFMELFCLGPNGPDGTPNYTQSDVQELARAFTGWRLDSDDTSPTYGQVTFDPARFDNGTKTILGRTGAFTAQQAVDIVLAHPNHAQFLIRKLWAEFIAAPIPPDTLSALVAAYKEGGALRLRPVLRGILTHSLIFESLDEPNLVKPPIVFTVGVLRQMGVPMKAHWIPQALQRMQQRPYRPPNVAGWEGGLSWLNSNTVQARFDLIVRAQWLKYRGDGASSAYPGMTPPPDVPGETPQAAFDRAYASVSSPWLSAAARAALMAYATAAPVDTVQRRRQRFYTLQALMLGGPEAQVM
jgi:uncharacterized protein (DUF1800 family)